MTIYFVQSRASLDMSGHEHESNLLPLGIGCGLTHAISLCTLDNINVPFKPFPVICNSLALGIASPFPAAQNA